MWAKKNSAPKTHLKVDLMKAPGNGFAKIPQKIASE